MGFSTNSRMFVYGLVVLSCLNEETFGRKLELFRSYGFSKEEVLQMFRKAPLILKASEERLQLGLEFFLKEIECEKSVLKFVLSFGDDAEELLLSYKGHKLGS
ncbi:hypothetical protein AB3S75_000170 [Citrus x aurantiifolia]